MDIFEKNSTVCFLGDSITARGHWEARIFDYYAENFADRRVKFYNCGVPGGRAITAIPRLQCDVFNRNPTHIVLMFGMNDCAYYLYEEGKVLNAEEKAWKEETKKQYMESMRCICNEIIKRNIKLILCTPTPYDEEQICETTVCRCDSVLADFSEKIRALSTELNVPLVDFRKEFCAVTEKVRAENKNNNLISPDRVHPDTVGMEVMADIFLKSQGLERSLDLNFSEWQKRAEIPYSDKNSKRFEIEKNLRSLSYIDWDYILNLKPKTQDDIEFLKNRLETEQGTYQRDMIEFYLQNKCRQKEWEEALCKATEAMY